MTARVIGRWAGLAAALCLVACDAGPETITGAARGREVFRSARFSNSQFNVYACATCHSTTLSASASAGASAAAPIAVSLRGVAERASWWGGNVTTLYAAVDTCWTYFMRGHPTLDRSSDDARALFEYLTSLDTGTALPTAPLTVVESIAPVGRGDAARGAATFARSCAGCHGEPHTGRGRIGSEAVIVPEDSDDFADANGFDPDLVVIEKIRHGSFFGVSGTMPFFPREVLSDLEIADLLAYLDPHLP